MDSETTHDWAANPDSLIVERITTSVETEENIHKKMFDFVDKQKKKNPELGEIRAIKHEIKFKEDRPITCNSYTIPFRLQKTVDKELKRLEKLNVI